MVVERKVNTHHTSVLRLPYHCTPLKWKQTSRISYGSSMERKDYISVLSRAAPPLVDRQVEARISLSFE